MPAFYERFRECAERWPDNVALQMQRRDGLESYTYAEVRRMAESLGYWITTNGYARGSRLAILADNHPRWIIAYLGTIAAGCAAVPLDTAFHADQVTKLLKDSGSSVLFCDSKHLSIAEAAVADLPIEIVLTERRHAVDETCRNAAQLDDIFETGPGTFSAFTVTSEDLAALLYTSGTTADPKGVMLTHGNLMGEADAVFSWANIGSSDAILGILPLFHALAQMANLFLPLVRGSRVVYLETLNTTELLRALQERDITAFACVPQFFYLIHERIQKEVSGRGAIAQFAFSTFKRVTAACRSLGFNPGKIFFRRIHDLFGHRMRYLVTGGSRFDAQVGRDFYSMGIDVYQAYGLTETTGGACATPPSDNVIGSVGKPLRGVELKIGEPQRSEDGPSVGEILLRGPIVMKGYWNRPDATSEVLREGWLRTGDLGYVDGGGNLFITGRKKEVIVLSSGKNIYPEEIEAYYLKSPFIKEICVLGLTSRPGEPFSERLHGVVVPDFEILRQKRIVNAKEVIRFDIENLSQQLASTKRILSYEVWQDDLPRTTTRKLKRFEIEKRVRTNQEQHRSTSDVPSEQALSQEEISWLDNPDVQRSLKIIRSSVKNAPETIRPKDNLELDLSLDSMQRVELLVALEKELGGDVEESQIGEIYTVRDLVDAVRASFDRSNATGGVSRFHGWESVFAESVSDPDVLAITKHRPVATIFWFLGGRLLQLFARDRFELEITGLDNLPKCGPFLICPNHQSFLDPVILASVLPFQIFHDAFAVGTSEIFGSGFMRRLARWLRVIVVDPDANLIPAMRAGAYGLRHRRVLILFPEGERSIDGSPKVFKKGAAILSIHMQVPIVPVALEGFFEVWPRGKKFFQRFNRLKMTFGEPIYPPSKTNPMEADYAELTSALRAKVVGMWQGLRGESSLQRSAAAAGD